jgi:hypothetical protein
VNSILRCVFAALQQAGGATLQHQVLRIEAPVQKLGANEVLIMGKLKETYSSRHEYGAYSDQASFGVNSKAHTKTTWSSDRYDDSQPMICWRAKKLPDNFVNKMTHCGNVHYVCVTPAAVVDGSEEQMPYMDHIEACRLAGAHI